MADAPETTDPVEDIEQSITDAAKVKSYSIDGERKDTHSPKELIEAHRYFSKMKNATNPVRCLRWCGFRSGGAR